MNKFCIKSIQDCICLWKPGLIDDDIETMTRTNENVTLLHKFELENCSYWYIRFDIDFSRNVIYSLWLIFLREGHLRFSFLTKLVILIDLLNFFYWIHRFENNIYSVIILKRFKKQIKWLKLKSNSTKFGSNKYFRKEMTF